MKFEIPVEGKESLRRDLARLGIRESNLFPDLEHLARELSISSYGPGEAD